jgi:surface protein
MNNRRRTAFFKGTTTPAFLPFIFTINTSNLSTGSTTTNQFKIPTINTGSYDFTVDWGDSSSNNISTWNDLNLTHTYPGAGIYEIKITGDIIGFIFNGTGDRLKMLNISQWGNVIFTPQTGANGGAFRSCSNLNISATDAPNFIPGNHIGFFSFCSSLIFNASINNWDVSPITSFSTFFNAATNFNQPIGNWDVSNANNFVSMFLTATNFNQPIGNWNVSNATLLTNTFNQANNFNQDLSNWDVSKVTNFQGTFRSTAFNNLGNPNISNWDVSKVQVWGVVNGGCFASCPFNQPIGAWNMIASTSISAMFQGNSVFNQNIGAWDVSGVSNFTNTFNGATQFNNGGSPTINNWNTSNVTVMNSMFINATNFNQPIGNWNVSKVSAFQSMFAAASNFNQNIGAWVTSAAVNMQGMFSSATQFNNGGSPTINNWNTSNVTVMSANNAGMFSACSNFNQPLGNWDVSKVSQFLQMFRNCTALNQTVENMTNIWVMTLAISSNQMFSGCSNLTGNGNYFISKPKAAGYVVSTASTSGSYRTFFNCVSLTDFATIPAAYK